MSRFHAVRLSASETSPGRKKLRYFIDPRPCSPQKTPWHVYFAVGSYVYGSPRIPLRHRGWAESFLHWAAPSDLEGREAREINGPTISTIKLSIKEVQITREPVTREEAIAVFRQSGEEFIY